MAVSPNILHTSTFRMVALYLSLFVVSTGAVLGYVYWSTAGLLKRQTDDTIRAEITGLSEQYRQGGISQLVRTVAGRSRAEGQSIYLVTGQTGQKIAGNISNLPENRPPGEGWVEFPYAVATPDGVEGHDARAYLFRLPEGFVLLVGRDVNDRRYFVTLIRQAMLWAIGLTLLFGIGGGLLLSRNLLNRVDAISRTSRAIMQGDLNERMAVSGTGDELDRLAAGLNEMLDQIERLMTGMREVSDNVAHDLRTPLTRLRARLEDALRPGSNADHRVVMEETIVEADKLLATFNALLNIARTESGECRTAMVRIDACDVVREVCELYEPLVEEAGGELVFSACEDCHVEADRQLIAQAISNLVDNALKYGRPDEGDFRLAVSVSAADGYAELAVADNGSGIAQDDRMRAVERFVRLDASRSQSGSGLGLSLVHGVAKLHTGSFALEDNNPGLKAVLRVPLVGTQ